MGIRNLVGHRDYANKVYFKRPIRTDKLEHEIDDEKMIYANKDNFRTQIINVNGRRMKQTTGTLRTNQLMENEIEPDWIVIIDDEEYIIESMIQEDENTDQEHLTKNNTIITTLQVRC